MYIVQGKNNRETRKSTPKQIPKGLKLHFFFFGKTRRKQKLLESWKLGRPPKWEEGKMKKRSPICSHPELNPKEKINWDPLCTWQQFNKENYMSIKHRYLYILTFCV